MTVNNSAVMIRRTHNSAVRGGSWNFNPDYARAAARNFYRPDNRYDFIGFRVLCSSPIE